jgi:hypothetical protein
MNTIMIKAVETYQCPGCTNGPNPQTCPSALITDVGCAKHSPGTLEFGAGTFALGLPKGFCRFGPTPVSPIEVYESYGHLIKLHSTLTTKFSLPVWKHLDEHGNTIVRWFSARTNYGWSSVILGDCREQLPFALEITAEDIEGMD